jgi:transcriptional regulator with XRE-family HTH domain
VPIRYVSAESFVAVQTRNLRERRGWSQQRLAERLNTLLADDPPPEMFQKDDLRRARAETARRRRLTTSGKWTQKRIDKLERGTLRIKVDDLLELALALDVSPLALITPMAAPQGEAREQRWKYLRPRPGDVFQVWLGGNIARSPSDVRQWVRGVRPLLHLGDYETDDEAAAGRRFYLIEMQGREEWQLIEKAAEEARRARDVLSFLQREDGPRGQG